MHKIKLFLSKLPSAEEAGEEASAEVREGGGGRVGGGERERAVQERGKKKSKTETG